MCSVSRRRLVLQNTVSGLPPLQFMQCAEKSNKMLESIVGNLTMIPQVLIVDDDPIVIEVLHTYLFQEGYSVHCVATVEMAKSFISCQTVDLVMLDIRLIGCLALTRELRAHSEVGIILITGLNDEHDRIVGLECGADDYIITPINPRELVPRIRNLIRRAHHAKIQNPHTHINKPIKKFGDWKLDTGRRRLINKTGGETLLTHSEYRLLNVFLGNSGLTLTRNQLMNQIRNRDLEPNDRSIDVLVARLRRKLLDSSVKPKIIITIHGVGYLFTAAVAI